MQGFCFCSLNMQNLWCCRCRRVVDLKLPIRVQWTVENSNNHDDEGKRNVKTFHLYKWKQQFCTLCTVSQFCTFHSLSRSIHDVKWRVFQFCGQHKHGKFSIFFSALMQLCDRHFASQITWKDCKKMLQKHIMFSGKVFAFFDGWFRLQNFIRPDERNFWLIWKIHQWHEVWRNGRLAGQWIFYLRWTIILQWNTTEQIELEQLQWFSNTDKLSESLVCPRFQRGGLTSTRVSGFTWLALHLPVWKAVH